MKLNKQNILRILLLIGIIAVAAWVTIEFRAEITPQAIKQHLNQFGILAPLIFIIIYAIAIVFLIPRIIFTLAGGYIYGPVLGTFYSITGATIGLTLAFIISRYISYDQIKRKAGSKVNFIIDGISNEGWRFVAFLRIVPLVPFNILNYLLGISEIRLLPYSLTSAIAILPGTIAFTYLGYTGGQAAASKEGITENILIAIALLAIAAYLPRLVKKYRNRKKP